MIRALGYYLAHSFVNQVRKMLRTWVVILILACGLLGGLFGYAGAYLFDDGSISSEEQTEEDRETIAEDQAEEGGDSAAADILKEGMLGETIRVMGKTRVMEAGLGLLLLVLFFYAAFSGVSSGSAIFLPADAALLFPSPNKPQSVLLFRLVCRMGFLFAMSLIFLCNLPAIMDVTGMSLSGAVYLIPAWIMIFLWEQLLQTAFYTYAGSAPGRKKKVRTGIYVCLLALAVVFTACVGTAEAGANPLTAVVCLLSAPSGRWIPVWGWLRGVVFSAEGGNALFSILFIMLLFFAGVLLISAIYRMKADFYEDALETSEAVAKVMEDARQGRFSIRSGKKKDRPDRLVRDGLRHGQGAGVFFWKELYNRYRFAHLHLFTATSETYLVVALAASMLGKRLMPDKAAFFPFLAIATFVFFRSLGNPLEKDLRTVYFHLVPEKTWKKLFWSELGGIAGCLLDVFFAMALGSILTGMGLPMMLGGILFTITVYYYSMNVGAFMDSTLPAGAGGMLKQVIQMMFVYFGLLPDIAIIAVGFSGKVDRLSPVLSLVLAALVNIGIGVVFMSMIPAFLDPAAKRTSYKVEEPAEEERKAAGKEIRFASLSCALVFAAGSLLQIILGLMAEQYYGQEEISETVGWLLSFLPLYAVAFPAGILLLLRKKKTRVSAPGSDREGESPAKVRMTFLTFFLCFCAGVFLMYSGNFVGSLINAAIRRLTGTSSLNTAVLLAGADSVILKILFAVILGPVFEELLFRKGLLDLLFPLGEKYALLFSAAAFALFHGNLVQLTYAFLIGLLFAYIYMRTRQIRWTIILHISLNFMGEVAAPAALLGKDTSDPGIAGILFLVFLAAFFLIGMSFVITHAGQVYFLRQSRELPEKTAAKLTWTNVGWLLFVALMVCMIAYSFLQG